MALTESYVSVDSLAAQRRWHNARLHPDIVAELHQRVTDGVLAVNVAAFFAEVLGPGEWRTRAACRGEDVELFFPRRGQGGFAAIAALCRSCPVVDDCRDYATSAPERHGIWAGESVAKRRRGRRYRACIECGGDMAGRSNSARYCVTCSPSRQRSTIVSGDATVPVAGKYWPAR